MTEGFLLFAGSLAVFVTYLYSSRKQRQTQLLRELYRQPQWEALRSLSAFVETGTIQVGEVTLTFSLNKHSHPILTLELPIADTTFIIANDQVLEEKFGAEEWLRVFGEGDTFVERYAVWTKDDDTTTSYLGTQMRQLWVEWQQKVPAHSLCLNGQTLSIPIPTKQSAEQTSQEIIALLKNFLDGKTTTERLLALFHNDPSPYCRAYSFGCLQTHTEVPQDLKQALTQQALNAAHPVLQLEAAEYATVQQRCGLVRQLTGTPETESHWQIQATHKLAEWAQSTEVPTPYIELLEVLLESPAPELRDAALESFGDLDQQPSIEIIERLVSTGFQLELPLIEVLSQYTSGEAREKAEAMLLSCFKRKQKKHGHQLIDALSQVGGMKSVEQLSQFANQVLENNHLRTAARDAVQTIQQSALGKSGGLSLQDEAEKAGQLSLQKAQEQGQLSLQKANQTEPH